MVPTAPYCGCGSSLMVYSKCVPVNCVCREWNAARPVLVSNLFHPERGNEDRKHTLFIFNLSVRYQEVPGETVYQPYIHALNARSY